MSTTLTLAMNGTAAPCIEDLRLEADQAGLTDWAQGKALHVLIDALEGTGEKADLVTELADGATEFADGCPELLGSFDDSLSDLTSSLETLLTNEISDLPFLLSKDQEAHLADLKRIRKHITERIADHKTHRKVIEDHGRALKAFSASVTEISEELA